MDQRPRCKTGHYKTLKGKHRRNLSDMNHSKIFSDPPPRAMKIKTKINKLKLIKLQSFCTAKETITINKTKRQSTEWEKILQMK